MNRHTVENYKMLTRVSDFATMKVGLFPKTSLGLEIQKALVSAVRELDALSSARVSAETVMRSVRKDRIAAREALKGRLVQASRTARALGSEAFRTSIKPTDHELMTFVRAFAADIEPMKKEFLGYGISPDDVAAAVREQERTIRDYSAGMAKRAAVIREFEAKTEAARGDMRRFEALVENFLAKNASVMAEWKVARSVGRVSARKRSVKPAEPVNPAVSPIAA
jgi:hypothetical protein